MLIFKYPTKGRPALFQQTLEIYLSLLSGKHECRFVVSCDESDDTMNNAAMREWIAMKPNVEVHFNANLRGKVSAINANMDGQSFDLLVLISDDMLPAFLGFDDRIIELFSEFFPNGDGVLHLNDGRVGRQLNTLPITDFKYYSRFNYIYNPAYASLHCDDEWQAVSERLGLAVYVNEVVIWHNWIGDTHPSDPLHRHNESFYDADARTFRARQAAGFPL